MTAGGKGNIAGHDEPQFVALTADLHACALEFLAQLGLLAVHVVAHTATDSASGNSAGQSAPRPVGPAGTGRTDHRSGNRPYARAFGGAAGLALPGVGVSGSARRQ